MYVRRPAEELEELTVPPQRRQVDQEGAAGVRGLGDVLRTSGEMPGEPARYVAEKELTCLGTAS